MEKYFSVKNSRKNKMIPLVANIPHSSTFIPKKIRKKFTLNSKDLMKELHKMTDHYTDELFSATSVVGGVCVIYKVSRLVVDPERFIDDKKEKMSKKGMGVIYEKTSDGNSLRNKLNNVERKKLIEKFYRPYHYRLEKEVQTCLDNFKSCIIIDCHSFPSQSLPFEDSTLKRPDICIGTSEFHTPKNLKNKIIELCKKNEWTIAENEPFSGTYVPMEFYKKYKRVHSVMIEVNRKLYMDEKTGEKLERFTYVKEKLSQIIEDVANQY